MAAGLVPSLLGRLDWSGLLGCHYKPLASFSLRNGFSFLPGEGTKEAVGGAVSLGCARSPRAPSQMTRTRVLWELGLPWQTDGKTINISRSHHVRIVTCRFPTSLCRRFKISSRREQGTMVW